MRNTSVTRGFGLLETFLSHQRMKIANKLIKEHDKNGTILDIGCGTYPKFLINSNFNLKFGIDKEINNIEIKNQGIKLINHDILMDSKLPFQKESFDVIAMLAVIEHIKFDNINKVLKNCYSLLKEKGIIIITTPAKRSDSLLKIMAKLNLVSKQEIEEHKNSYTINQLHKILLNASFVPEKIDKGYFEFFLNLWICAIK